MDHLAHLSHFRADSATLLAAQAADPHAPVVTCPGWDRTDLLAHVAGMHAWVRAQVEHGPDERVRLSSVAPPPGGADLAPWYEDNAARLLEAMTAMDVTATWPTWAGPQPGSFYPRRVAQETAVHRWDAVGGAIDAVLAADGVDEMLAVFVGRVPAERLAGARGTIHLHATDDGLEGTGEWLIELSPDEIRSERGHAKGDVALRGRAQDLLLWTWNRVPVDDRFEVFGDPSPLDRWRAAVVF